MAAALPPGWRSRSSLGALVFGLVYVGGQVGGSSPAGCSPGPDGQRWDPGGSGVSATPTPDDAAAGPALTPAGAAAGPPRARRSRSCAGAGVGVGEPPRGDHPRSSGYSPGLRPYTTDAEFLGARGVDSRNIPASQTLGDPDPGRAEELQVEVEAPTDTLRAADPGRRH
ncbi:hypothetical protein HBB16_05680 [Pseudonocardia sp. MCCB 268]|nr:hypothetical protein [Pseudonocardia cytotoxica]